ncbi:MAG: 2OG-Fe(II) oxygenase [Myxococcales bacterium]|nr:2OG-Fe(II) oxygenase [Myxococcales bacterium]
MSSASSSSPAFTPLASIERDVGGEASSVRGLRWLPEFVPPAECARIVAAFAAAPRAWATTRASDGRYVVDRARRSVRHVQLPEAVSSSLRARFRALIPALARAYETSLRDVETPQALVYGPGDGYGLHRDVGAGAMTARRVSAALLLNDDFDGGQLRLHHNEGGQRLRYEPRVAAGALVLFRPETLHEVTPVTAGSRYAIVTWYV